MDGSQSETQDLITVTQTSGMAVITINRPKSLNSLTRAMMVSLAHIIRRLDADPSVLVLILTGAGARAFCSGVDLAAAEDVFKGDVKDLLSDPVAQLEACGKPVIGAINGYAVTAGFEIALACDILVAAKDAKFIDTHAKFGIFPSWGLSQKLSRIIGPVRARHVSLTAMPVTAGMAERWGLVNHVVEQSSQALPKAQEIAAAIIKNNRDLVPKYKAVINDGFKLDLASALALEKERAHSYYDGMTKDQFAMMQKFIQGGDWKRGEIFSDDRKTVGNNPEEREDLLTLEVPAPPKIRQDEEEEKGEENGGLYRSGKELKKLLGKAAGVESNAENNNVDHEVVGMEESPTTTSRSGVSRKGSFVVGKSKQSSVVPTFPITEDEVHRFILSRVKITTHELVGKYKSRLRSNDDKKAFTEVLKRISKIQKLPSGISYVVLK